MYEKIMKEFKIFREQVYAKFADYDEILRTLIGSNSEKIVSTFTDENALKVIDLCPVWDIGIAITQDMINKGLADGNERLIRHGKKDCIHEPYRRTLLPFFDSLQNLFETDTDGILLISGSGSTCIGISKKYLSEQAKQKITGLEGSISIRELPLCLKGASVL